MVMFLWWCFCGGVLVVVLWCSCGGVFGGVVMFLWWCSCGENVVFKDMKHGDEKEWSR